MSNAAERDRELRDALRIAGLGVWRWDPQSNRIEWDDQVHALYGRPPNTFNGEPEEALALIHPDDRKKMQALFAATPEQGARVVDHRVLLPDGRFRWISASLSYVHGDGDKGVFTGIAWDATERYEMLSSLRSTQAHLEQAHRIARVATWTWTQAEGVRWSAGMYELYGVPNGQVQDGSRHWERLHPEDRERIRREYVEVLKSRESEFKHEFRVCLPDGQTRRVLSTFRIERDVEGRARSVIGVAQDVTEQARAAEERLALEAQLHQAQRLESLGALASGIAHDFNNILLAIGGNAQLALADCPRDEPLRRCLLEIEKARVRASDLVRRILTFSRPAALDQRPLDLEATIKEAVKLLRAALPAMIELRVHVRSPLPTVLADPGQIHQVIMNLATNAAQAIGDRGGIIEVLAEEAHEAPSADRRGRGLRLTVRDNGPGMDAAVKARMFEPFFTTKGATGGTGLGLAVVYGIVQAHRGVITVDSSPGAGARIHILLPVCTDVCQSPSPEVAAPHYGAGQRILYLDDEESLVYMASRVLERMNYRVTTFTDPVLALAALREHPGDFDAVVTDLAMPGMSGVDVADAVAAIRADIPVVLVSGHALDEEFAGARAGRIPYFVFKPEATEALPRVLDEAFRNARAAQASETARRGPARH